MAPRQPARRLLAVAPAVAAAALVLSACHPPNEQPADPDHEYTLPSYSEPAGSVPEPGAGEDADAGENGMGEEAGAGEDLGAGEPGGVDGTGAGQDAGAGENGAGPAGVDGAPGEPGMGGAGAANGGAGMGAAGIGGGAPAEVPTGN